MDVVRMRLQETTHCRPAFGEPRPLIQHEGHFPEWPEIDFHSLPAELLELFQRLAEELFLISVAEEFEVFVPRGDKRLCGHVLGGDGFAPSASPRDVENRTRVV